MRDMIKTNWITRIKISSKKMRLLDNQRTVTVMKKKDLGYIEHYRKRYRRVIKETERRENNSYIIVPKPNQKQHGM